MSNQWVLVRGIMSESFHWGDFIPLLNQQFPQDQFYTADILGNGLTSHRKTPLSIKKNIAHLRSQSPDKGKKILLGFSLGGMLSLEWAHHHPEDIKAVVLINCSLNNSPVYRRLTPYSISKIMKSALAKDHQAREEMILRLTTSSLPQQKLSHIAKHWGQRGLERRVQALNFFRQLYVASKIQQRPTNTFPVLVLSSLQDRVVHPECSHRIAHAWSLELHTHPHAGHDLTLDDPQWVLEKLQDFISHPKLESQASHQGANLEMSS